MVGKRVPVVQNIYDKDGAIAEIINMEIILSVNLLISVSKPNLLQILLNYQGIAGEPSGQSGQR